MTEVFADTSFFVASCDPRDAVSPVARRVVTTLGAVRLVTTHAVLAELLNYFAERGPALRTAATLAVRAILDDSNTTVVAGSEDRFDRAFERYVARNDKGYSLTDCGSMLVMEERGIAAALTADRHFVQAGFDALLLDG